MLRPGFLDSGVDDGEQHQPLGQPRSDLDLRRKDCIYINSPVDIVYCSHSFAYYGYLYHDVKTDRIEHLEITVDSLGLGSATISDLEIELLIMTLKDGESLKSLKLISNYTGPDFLRPEWRMVSFMWHFEHSISYWEAWRFPEFSLVCKETGLVLAKRQLCTSNEKQDSYEWDLMGMETTCRRVYIIEEAEGDASS